MNQHSGFEIAEQQAERREGRCWMRRLGDKGLACSYFMPPSAVVPLPADCMALLPAQAYIPLPTDCTALLLGLQSVREEEAARQGWERKSGLTAVSSPPSGPPLGSTVPLAG